MKYTIALIVAATMAIAAGTTASGAQSDRPLGTRSDLSRHTPVLQRYCVGCHNARTRTADLALDNIDINDIAAHPEIWEKVVRKLRTGAMPPAGMPRPDTATYESLASGLEAALDAAAVSRPQPGAPWLHRLNRTEYANAIRDLLALEIDAATLLPADDAAAGFDNNAGALGISPTLLERYLSAAAKISALAVGDATLLGPTSQTYVVRGDMSQDAHVEGLPLGTRGGVLARHTFPLDGQYVLEADLLQTNLGAVRGLLEPHEIEFSVDGKRVFQASVGGDADNAMSAANAADIIKALDTRLTTRVPITAGPHVVVAAFLKRTSAQGGSKLQPFLRTTLDAGDHTGLPHVASLTDHRSVREHRHGRHAEPTEDFHLPARPVRRNAMCRSDSVHARFARVSPTDHEGGKRSPADALSSRSPAGNLRDRDRVRTSRHSGQSEVRPSSRT